MKTLDRTIAPSISAVNHINFPEPDKVILPNRIPVYHFNLGTQNLLQIDVCFNAGVKFQNRPLVASYTNKLIGEASQNFLAGQIIDEIDFYGAFFEATVDNDKANITLYCLEKFIDKVLPVFLEAVFKAEFPEKEFKITVENGRQKFLEESEKVGYLCRQNFNALLFDGHPYGQVANEVDFKRLTLDDVKSFYKAQYHPGNCKIFIAGKYCSETKNRLEKAFSSLVGTPEEKKNIPFVSYVAGKHFISKHEAIQSGIRIGCNLNMPYGSDDYFNMKVLNTVIGGYFGSRLMANIREDKGYTYGIGSAVADLDEGNFFFISTEVGAEVTEAALTEIYNELARLTSELIPTNELEEVKNYMLGSLLKEADGPFSIMDLYKAVESKKSDFNYYRSFISRINMVTPEELMQLASKVFKEDKLLELVVGNKKE